MATISCVEKINNMESLNAPPVASLGFWASRSVHNFEEDACTSPAPSPKSGKANAKKTKQATANAIMTTLTKEQQKLKKTSDPAPTQKKMKVPATTAQSWDKLLATKRQAVSVKKSADVGDDIRWDVILTAMKELGTPMKAPVMLEKAKKEDEEGSESNGSTSVGGDDSEQFSDCSCSERDACDDEAWEDALEVPPPSYSLNMLLACRPKVVVAPKKKGLHTQPIIEEKKKVSNVAEKIKVAPWRKTPSSTPVTPSLAPPPGLAPPGLKL